TGLRRCSVIGPSTRRDDGAGTRLGATIEVRPRPDDSLCFVCAASVGHEHQPLPAPVHHLEATGTMSLPLGSVPAGFAPVGESGCSFAALSWESLSPYSSAAASFTSV